MKRNVQSSQRGVELIALQLAWSAGTPSLLAGASASQVTITDNGTGDVSVTLVNPALRVGVAVATPVASAGDAIVCLQAQPTASVARFVVFDGTDGTTAKDNIPLNIMIVAFRSADAT